MEEHGARKKELGPGQAGEKEKILQFKVSHLLLTVFLLWIW